ncbi:MAG: homocysteine S-methyltransferase family protein, partial [Sphingomonadaceae bacterium]
MARFDPAGLDRVPFLTDAGLETWLLFVEGIDLPCFAAYPLLDSEAGRERLARYFRPFMDTATEGGFGLVLETPTWRASADWGARLGHDAATLDRLNRAGVALLDQLRAGDPQAVAAGLRPISGNLGPRGDGYRAEAMMQPDVAQAYHAAQVASLADAGADLISALTMTHAGEALGIARAVHAAGLPCVIAFTVETDGRLPDGSTLAEAIDQVDAGAPGAVSWFMINCAHPDHIAPALADAGDWTGRVRALRVNASRKSHAELDEASDLDDGDPAELGPLTVALRSALPQLAVFGGCCG